MQCEKSCAITTMVLRLQLSAFINIFLNYSFMWMFLYFFIRTQNIGHTSYLSFIFFYHLYPSFTFLSTKNYFIVLLKSLLILNIALLYVYCGSLWLNGPFWCNIFLFSWLQFFIRRFTLFFGRCCHFFLYFYRLLE